MRKGVLIAAFVVLVGVSVVCTAFAEPRAYTYGGSGMDVLVSITVSDDGRIAMTGASDSSDGTLSGRTKTGHSGWVLCVDAQGEVLFSFLTRRGARDYLHLPVFHEDGSLTVVLDTDTDTGSELELIRLNREGDVVSRRLLKAREGATSVLLTGVAMDEGILCDESVNSRIIGCTLFAWDGERLREWGETDMPDYIAWTGRHAIRNMGDGEWLESIDASGVETPLLRVMQWQKDNWDVYYNALVSLEDGGAAAVGRAWSGVSEGEGCIARWDAQGNPVFSWWMPNAVPLTLERTANGFAAAVYPAQTENAPYDWTLALFDEDGLRTGAIPLGRGIYGCQTATMPDGAIAALVSFTKEEDPLDVDVRLVIVPQEDLL